MNKKPGIMFELPDKRKAIVYNNQPLMKEKGKVIINLLNDDLSLKMVNSNPSLLMKSVEIYNEEVQTWKMMGYVD